MDTESESESKILHFGDVVSIFGKGKEGNGTTGFLSTLGYFYFSCTFFPLLPTVLYPLSYHILV